MPAPHSTHSHRPHPSAHLPAFASKFVRVAALAALVLLSGCGSKEVANRDPTGEVFPSVKGESLAGVETPIPEGFAGEPTILLVAYEQEAQFDIDRWLLGLLQVEVEANLVELPTLPGLAPTFASQWIDDGMRSGIPKEDWGVVVTLYGDAARPVAELTGTENGRLTRVLLLDGEGRVAWFDDEGFSPRKVLELVEKVRALRAALALD